MESVTSCLAHCWGCDIHSGFLLPLSCCLLENADFFVASQSTKFRKRTFLTNLNAGKKAFLRQSFHTTDHAENGTKKCSSCSTVDSTRPESSGRSLVSTVGGKLLSNSVGSFNSTCGKQVWASHSRRSRSWQISLLLARLLLHAVICRPFRIWSSGSQQRGNQKQRSTT